MRRLKLQFNKINKAIDQIYTTKSSEVLKKEEIQKFKSFDIDYIWIFYIYLKLFINNLLTIKNEIKIECKI